MNGVVRRDERTRNPASPNARSQVLRAWKWKKPKLNAQKFATTGAQKAELEVNLAVLDMDKDRSGAKRTFDSYKGTTPEALVNLGIILDLEGDSRGALDAWQDAQKRGVGGKVRDWIEAKKKILGSK